MKNILHLVLLLAFSSIPAWSQTCSVAKLQTQADVDNFSASYPGCTVIDSDLEITSPTITNLDGLRAVTHVTRSLKINQNPNLTSIAGLSSLTQIDAGLSISGNDNLLTLDGLDHLTSVKNISIVNDKRLTSISALDGITRIGNISIESNPALITLNGLHNVTRVRGALKVVQNDNLLDLNGLRKVRQVDYILRIANNKSLKNLQGLERLETLTYQFTTYFEITGNKALTSIAELGQLQGDVEVRITNNPLLSDCAIKLICQRIAFGEATISGNAAGCANTEEIRTSSVCMPQTLVRINAGGPDFTTATQKLFVADQYYVGIDRTSSIASGDILNTTNDVLYRSGRSSTSFSYNIPVLNDQVNVTLHFAEIYFGAPGKKGGAGSRQFHVNIEGSRKLTNYDIFCEAGGALRAVQLTIPATVTDGVLNIDFLSGAADLPRVSAIEVTASPTLIPVEDGMVNLGFFSYSNYVWADNLNVEGVPSGDNRNINWRSYLKFQLPSGKAAITSAKLRIYGRNSENNKSIAIHAYGVNDDSWTEATLTGNNAPAASTQSLGFAAINDVYQYYEIDVTSYVKAQRQSGEALISFLLNNPNSQSTLVEFSSKEAGSNPPQLIYQTTNIVQTTNMTARINQEQYLTEVQEKQLSTVYPNPAQDQFSVLLSAEHSGPISFELINATGESGTISALQSARPGENAAFDITGQTLTAGTYILKIKSNTFSQKARVLISK